MKKLLKQKKAKGVSNKLDELKKMYERNSRLAQEVVDLKAKIERLRFPTGVPVRSDKQLDALFAVGGRAVLKGVEALLFNHIYEASAEVFDPTAQPHERSYFAGGCATLEQFRIDLTERTTKATK